MCIGSAPWYLTNMFDETTDCSGAGTHLCNMQLAWAWVVFLLLLPCILNAGARALICRLSLDPSAVCARCWRGAAHALWQL
jgi:hypothetical protein